MPTHTLTTCPACSSSASTPVEHDSPHELRRCTACSLVYATRYADPGDIYVDGYLSGQTDFGLDIFDPHFQEFLDFAAAKRMDVIESIRPATGSLLDVGCGAGEVLAEAQRRGWTVGGAEPVEESAGIARQRGLDVRTALLADAGFAKGEWDVVTAFHVLEHLPEGVPFLRSLAEWARPGGLVVIELPNWASHDRARHGARWTSLRPLEHVAHYDTDTLRQTFERAGLEPVLVRSMGFLWPKQTLQEQLADLAHERWASLLRPLSRKEERRGTTVSVPGTLAHRFLLATQAAYDRQRKGQVAFGAARVPL
jgi:2-polyprenyl-3-methyl-5-hydroxy-6-metoxy-1,4-benzoquinol methylase